MILLTKLLPSEHPHKWQLGCFWWELLFRASSRNIHVSSIILLQAECCTECFWCLFLHRYDSNNDLGLKGLPKRTHSFNHFLFVQLLEILLGSSFNVPLLPLQGAPKVLCWPMGTWWLIFQAFWRWRRWIPWWRECCRVQSVFELSRVPAWAGNVLLQMRGAISLAQRVKSMEMAARLSLEHWKGIKSPSQHCLPGSVGHKALLRSNVDFCKSINGCPVKN